MNELRMHVDRRGPLLIQSTSGIVDLAELVSAHSGEVTERLIEHGALVFRGFAHGEPNYFENFVQALACPRMDYVYGSTPRTRVGDRIFTATEYPPSLEIPLHSECSYQREWPLKIAFCCVEPAATGGYTPLADLRRVGAILGEAMLDEFQDRGVRYVRNYQPYIDVSWQTVFQTKDRDAVTRFLCGALHHRGMARQ